MKKIASVEMMKSKNKVDGLKSKNHPSAIYFIACLLAMFFSCTVLAQPLAGTDDLNRTLPQNAAVGDPVINKTVAIFYFLWQGHPASKTTANFFDLTKVVKNNPGVLNNFTDPYWGPRDNSYYYWGQSIYNYYKGDDYWVHLKNAQLLTDAGVDLVVIDATNAISYPQESQALMNALDAVRAQGKTPPKIVYYTNSKSGFTMQACYDNFYKTEAPFLHPSCWFYIDGKPLIIGTSSETIGKNYQDFFTYRESQWPNEPAKINGWPWIEFVRPQKVYSNNAGEREIVNVSVAQHPNLTGAMGGSAFYGTLGNWGRSYRNGSVGKPLSDLPYGYNIQEQWDYAIAQNVPYIFVTGWNEWIVGRWPSNDGDANHSLFVDQASAEFSRDIEPSLTGNLKDNYYMQLVANIRKYKGLERSALLSARATITRMQHWTSVTPAYADYTGDVIHRNNLAGLSTILMNNIAIPNFGFSAPAIAASTGYAANVTGGSWMFSNNAGIVTNGAAAGNVKAIEGLQAAFIQRTGYFQQSLSFHVAGKYTMYFSAAQRTGSMETFEVFYDNILVGSFNPASTTYQQYTCLFSATKGSHTIKFIGTKSADHTCFVDNISIAQSTPVTYTNTTGRNDFAQLKVARNNTNLYFYAKTVANISSNAGSNWMQLYLDVDRNANTGWKGYDYRVIGRTQLQKWIGGAWANTCTILVNVIGNEMYYTIPRSCVGDLADPLDLEFKWSDNMQDDTDPLDWYVNGDAAPGARFNFIATERQLKN